MTIFKKLGNDFLKLTLSDREYKKLLAREGIEPAPITIPICVIDGIVKMSGNSGHVYLPKAWVGKSVKVTLIQ